jgi:ribosomal-protein-alanine N-acetyltransferase
MERTEIRLRPMNLDDLLAVGRSIWPHLPFPGRKAYRYELTQNPALFYWWRNAVCQVEKVMVGMVVVWIVLDEAHIATIAVHPDYRHTGVGRGLLAAA